MSELVQRTPVRREITVLFQAAMVIFIVTVLVGILNGLNVVEFDRKTLMTHVHAGTLGWITLGVLAACLWFFSGSELSAANRRFLSATGALAIVSFLWYVFAFFNGDPSLRAISSVPVFVAIAGFFGWVIAQSRSIRLGVAHLAIIGATANLTVGAVIGALLQFQAAANAQILPEGAYGAHPTTMVIGYLLLVGMAISEWRFIGETGRLSRLGLVQIGLPFLGGVALTLGSLLDIQALFLLNVPLEILGVLVYIWRFAPYFLRIRWTQRTPDRHFGLSGVFLVANVALLSYLIVSFLSGAYGDPPDFALIPPWMIFGLDHAMFIGVMTNALFALIQLASWEQRAFWPWVDDVLFWGMNFGMVGFVASLLAHSPQLEMVFTPIMGGSILLAILTYTIRLQIAGKGPVLAEAPSTMRKGETG
ncbi:MAG: hypothetical protein HYX89_06565 [Chloroflexi bacterium]|nr:hypothetical protein [Chloroflexota bacterium]